MNGPDEAHIRQWTHDAIERSWASASLSELTPLRGDASTRRFWRAAISARHDAPATAIVIDLGPDDLPRYARALGLLSEPLDEPPWLNVHRFLVKIGVAVPAVYVADTASRLLMVEDVGKTPLFEAATHGDAADLYRLAADELLIFHLEGTKRVDARCIGARIAYDAELFLWELEQFADLGIAYVSPGTSAEAIRPELNRLAALLDRYPRVFSHRDYHGNNLYIQYSHAHDGGVIPRLRVIDFQDALMAPAAQDLAVLLTTRDTSRIITPTIERRMLDYYYAALIRRDVAAISFEDFQESYRLCVLQHALKVVGRFVQLERDGKSGYSAYIPFALEQARRMLARGDDFPELHAALIR